ncbi:hypothetical protein ACFQ22_04805 [Lentilactobacillus raoultii]|uniref:D-alanyl-D-alanine carboxypeptidase n=1 Tax=Lentilactobacillus raoultii TaxID=1987503 RepID=A0ABW3PES1_9LACO|nr:hypothetical protein [Lentilactobacillus raoultii]
MLNKLMKGLLVFGLACGIGFTTQAYAVHAAGPYHTIKSRSYANVLPTYRAKTSRSKAVIWNNDLTQKKFSLNDYPKTNWYVYKSYKMTNGKKTGIFYRIKNPENTVSGLVWRGYLRRINHLSIKQQTLNALPGTIYSPYLQKIVNQRKNYPGDSGGEYLQKVLGSQYKQLKIITLPAIGRTTSLKQLQSGQISYNAFLQRELPFSIKGSYHLKDGLAGVKTVKDLTGWQVAFLKAGNNSKDYGAGFIYFLKP